MGLLSFLAPSWRARQSTPHRDPALTPVTVKRTNRDRPVDGIAFDLDGCKVDLVREHLPNRPRAPDAPLREALIARAFRARLRAGLRLTDQEAKALADAIDALSAYAVKQGRA